MKMTKYFICCEKCFETAAKRSSNAAKLWMDFCAIKLQEGEVLCLQKNFPELRTLESLGFLVSTDLEDSIAVRIKGHMTTEDGEHFFCIKEGCHD